MRRHVSWLFCAVLLTPFAGCELLGGGGDGGEDVADAGGDSGPSGCDPDAPVQPRCTADDPTIVELYDTCQEVAVTTIICRNDEVCVDVDIETGAPVEADCGPDLAKCARELEPACSSDGASIVGKNTCTGEEVTVLTCGEGQMCSTKDIDRPALTVDPQCVPVTCTTPHHQKALECSPFRDDLVIERDLCNGDTSIERPCLGDTICGTVDPDTGEPMEADCVDEPDVCTPRLERACDPERPNAIFDVDVCTGEGTEVFDCGDGICSTFDPWNPARRVTPQCVDAACTTPHETVRQCDTFNRRRGVTIDLCNGRKTTYLECRLDEICTTEDPSDPSAQVDPYCVTRPVTCGGNRVSRECGADDPAAIVEVDSCSGEVTPVEDCGADICSTRDTLTGARVVEARCVAPECGSPHDTEQRCDDFNPRRGVTVDLCNGRKTTDFTCRLDEVCATEDPNDPGATVAPYCAPKPVVCTAEPRRECDPNDPSRVVLNDTCAGTITPLEDCGVGVCSTEDPNVINRRVDAQCVAPECGDPHDTEQRCDDFNPRRGVTVDLCNGRKTTDFTCPIGEECSTEDPNDPNATVAPYCRTRPVVCGLDDLEYACDPNDPRAILEVDTCQNTSRVAETCDAAEICSTSDPGNPARRIDAQCVPQACGEPHDVERRCDDFNPRRGVTVDLCNGGERVDFVCPLDQRCTTEDPNDPSATVDPYCYTPVPPCVPSTEFVCDPSNPSRVLERDTCTGEVTATTTCGAGELCSELSQTSRPQPVPAQCAPEACQVPHEVVTQCDTSNARRLVTIDVCTGDEVNVTLCGVSEVCTAVDPSDPTLAVAPRCADADCVEPRNDVTCDPNDPRQIISTNSCTGEVTVIQSCAGALEQCSTTDANGASIAPACVEQCGSDRAQTVCDPSDPSKVFYADACGNVTGERTSCDAPSTCEPDGAGGAQCACVSTGETRCIHGLGVPSLYQDSRVVEETTCGGTLDVDVCGFGERCFQDDDYNGGVAECARSIDDSASSSPYFDYGCGNITQFVAYKTSLEVDCRCRIYGFGEQGAGFADPVTGDRPGNSLQHCFNALDVGTLDWPIPAGMGPRMFAYTNANSANDTWLGHGYVDETNRILYALVRWTNGFHRASGTIVSFDLDTGDRAIISGIYPDPNLGDVDYGSGYMSPNTVTAGPATQPLTGVTALRGDASGDLYTLGVGTTGDGNSRSAEIVKIDPTTGARTLVWQSATDERGSSTAAYGQCLPNATATESLPITPDTLAIGPQGQFYLGFYHAREGTGLLEVSADGSTCRVVTWFNNQRDPARNFGGGFTPQSGNKIQGLAYRNGHLYGMTSLKSALVKVDVATGARVAVSTQADGYNGAGYANIFWDDTRGLVFAVGKVPNLIGAVIDEATGRREELFADTTQPGTPLLRSVYPARRSIYSPTTTLANQNYLGRGPTVLDPDDPDVLWMVIKGGALLKLELSTFNNYIFSL
jgi:hypothetical protein